jgi:cytochrome c oxidase subunit 2
METIRSGSRLALFAMLAAIAPAASCRHGAGARTTAPPPPQEQVIKVVARRWEFAPGRIVVTRGRPVVLELSSAEGHHGFSVPGLGVREELSPGHPTRVRFVPTQSGTFPFHCDVFCGEGHEEMTGEIVVAP